MVQDELVMPELIRVLQIVTQMNRAGMESRLMDIYRNIDRSRVQFDFYACRMESGIFDEEIAQLGGKIYYSKPLSPKWPVEIPKRFWEFLKTHPEYRIVHCHLNQWCGLVLMGAKKAGVPIRIAHSRTSLERASLKNVAKNVFKLPVNRYATHKFAVSRKAGNWLFGRKAMKSGEVEIWPNAIDVAKFAFDMEARRKKRLELDVQNALVLIHIGNLRPEKNHRYLLKIFLELRKTHPDAKLLLAGRDDLRGAMQAMAAEMGLVDGVLFLGSRSDVPELLSASDVFVFPSLYEGFPGAVLEAQAAGLPCVISDVITDEVRLLPTTKQLSLKLPAWIWAEETLACVTDERRHTYKDLSQLGYDVNSLSAAMTDFYERESTQYSGGKGGVQ